MTSGMKTGKLERHFSEAFGLLDFPQQFKASESTRGATLGNLLAVKHHSP